MENITQNILISINNLISVINKKDLPCEDLKLIEDKTNELKNTIILKQRELGEDV